MSKKKKKIINYGDNFFKDRTKKTVLKRKKLTPKQKIEVKELAQFFMRAFSEPHVFYYLYDEDGKVERIGVTFKSDKKKHKKVMDIDKLLNIKGYVAEVPDDPSEYIYHG